MRDNDLPPMLEIGNVLISMDCITEMFCCDLDECKGRCCIEGDAGAPVTLDEIMEIEDSLDDVWNDLSANAQAVIDKQGVAYVDKTGELVTSIVNGKDCAFTCYKDGCCLCTLQKLSDKDLEIKPISCSLYPIREKKLKNGYIALNYDRWDICDSARIKGKQLSLPVYKFLKEPLIRRFGKDWYSELEETVSLYLGKKKENNQPCP